MARLLLMIFLGRDDSGEAYNGQVLLMLVFVNRGGNVSFCETQNLSISPPCLGISLLWSLYNIPTQYQKKNIDDLCFSSTLWRRNPRKIISNLDNLSSQYWWHSIAFITLVCNIGRERKKRGVLPESSFLHIWLSPHHTILCSTLSRVSGCCTWCCWLAARSWWRPCSPRMSSTICNRLSKVTFRIETSI